MRKFYKNCNHYIISKIMIIAFSFHRIMVNVLLTKINILFHRNWNIEQKRRAGTISRQSPPSSVKFFSGLFTISNFVYILKHLKFKLTEENQASVEFYSDVLSQLDSDQGINNNNNNNFICTQQYTKILASIKGWPKWL